MRTFYLKLIIFLWMPLGLFAQNPVSGTVKEQATGSPLPGVNVIVKNTTNGVTSNFDGEFTINNVKKGDVLVFSYVGFKTLEVSYTGQSTIDVSLEEATNLLNEVVLVGYGSSTKKDMTGAVETVSTKDLTAVTSLLPNNYLPVKRPVCKSPRRVGHRVREHLSKSGVAHHPCLPATIP